MRILSHLPPGVRSAEGGAEGSVSRGSIPGTARWRASCRPRRTHGSPAASNVSADGGANASSRPTSVSEAEEETSSSARKAEPKQTKSATKRKGSEIRVRHGKEPRRHLRRRPEPHKQQAKAQPRCPQAQGRSFDRRRQAKEARREVPPGTDPEKRGGQRSFGRRVLRARQGPRGA